METEEAVRIRKKGRMIQIILPVIIATFVFGGLFGGMYLSSILGLDNFPILPLILATAGLALSLFVSYFIAKSVVF